MLPGSAVSGQPVTPSVRAAYAAPAVPSQPAPKPVAVATTPVDEPVPTADPAIAAAEPDIAAPDAAVPAAAQSRSSRLRQLQPGAWRPGSPAPGPARITSGVKLRGNPDNGAPTVGLLKTGDRVQVVQCKGWCEVVVDGKRGFVFKKFLASVSG